MPAKLHAAACVPGAVLATSSIIVYGDDALNVYINGTSIGGCASKCYKSPGTTLAVPPGLINLPPLDNVIAFDVMDTGGSLSGVSWDMTLNYDTCPTQHVVSDGFCTRQFYNGNLFNTSGTPSQFYPPGWETPGFVDTGWNGSAGLIPNLCGCPVGFWDNLTNPWIWGNSAAGNFNTAYKGDSFLFRQHFKAGDSSYCPSPPGPTATPLTTLTPGTVTPVPVGTLTNTPIPTPTPTCGTNIVAATLRFYADNYSIPYLNGVTLAVEANPGPTTLRVVNFTAGQLAILLPFPAVNVLSFQVDDSANQVGMASGNASGISYDLELSHGASCPKEHFVSNGFCVSTRQSGIRAGVGVGWPGGTGNTAWQTNAYAQDGTWYTPFAADRCHCGSCITPLACPGTNWGAMTYTAGVLWLGPGASDFGNIVADNRQLYRQIFQIGVVGCVPSPTPTNSPSNTPTSSRTVTPSSTPTSTVSPSATVTATRSNTATLTATPTPTPTATVTATRSSTATLTATPTPTPTATISFTRTGTVSSTGTETLTASSTQTPSRTVTETRTPTPSDSATATQSSTSTETSVYSSTSTSTWTVTPTATSTRTHTATATASPSASPTFTVSVTATQSATATDTCSETPSRTETAAISFTSTQTATSTRTDAPTASSTSTATPSATASATPSATPTLADTPTQSATRSATPSSTDDPTPGPSATITQTFTLTQTAPPPPARFKLVTVYPNPIGATGARFVFSLPRPATVGFWLYDLRGELIWSGSQSYPASGNYQYDWPATNNYGGAISYGAYYLLAKAAYSSGDKEQDGKWLTVLR